MKFIYLNLNFVKESAKYAYKVTGEWKLKRTETFFRPARKVYEMQYLKNYKIVNSVNHIYQYSYNRTYVLCASYDALKYFYISIISITVL